MQFRVLSNLNLLFISGYAQEARFIGELLYLMTFIFYFLNYFINFEYFYKWLNILANIKIKKYLLHEVHVYSLDSFYSKFQNFTAL